MIEQARLEGLQSGVFGAEVERAAIFSKNVESPGKLVPGGR